MKLVINYDKSNRSNVMKTPIQEVYENFNLMSDSDFKAWMLNTDLLEKERDIICGFANDFANECIREMKTKMMNKKEFYFLMGFFTAGTLALIAFGLSTIY